MRSYVNINFLYIKYYIRLCASFALNDFNVDDVSADFAATNRMYSTLVNVLLRICRWIIQVYKVIPGTRVISNNW